MTCFKRIGLLIIGLLSEFSLYAYDVEIDGFYYNVLSPTTLEVTRGEKKYEGKIIIPESTTYNGKTYDVVSVGNRAFEACDKLLSITMGYKITKIGERAFYGCSSLESYSFKTSNIGSYAFAYCTSIKSVKLNMSYIPEGLFLGCTSLSSLSINTTSIWSYAFSGCTALTNVKLACHVNENAFKDCTGITSVELTTSEGVLGTSLERDAFAGCTSIKKLTLKTNKAVSEYATISGLSEAIFKHCPDIEEIDVNDYKKITYTDGALYQNIYNKKYLLYILPKFREVYVSPSDLYGVLSYAVPKYLKRFVFSSQDIVLRPYAFANSSDLIEMYIYYKIFTFYFKNSDGEYYSHQIEQDFNENLIGKLKVFVPHGFWNFKMYPLPYFIVGEYDVMNFDPYSFIYEVDGIKYEITSETECKVTHRDDYSGDIVIPESVTINNKEYKVTSIGRGAFNINTNSDGGCKITSIQIPNNVTSIGEYNQEIKGETNVEIIPVIA